MLPKQDTVESHPSQQLSIITKNSTKQLLFSFGSFCRTG